MAGKTTDQIRVGANGSVFVSPVGTADPDDINAEWPDGWTDLGFTSEDGVTVTDSKTQETIPVWQLFYAARRIITERDLTLSFALRQWGPDQVRLAFGGGTITEDDTGAYRYTPPSPDFIDERQVGVEFTDGDITYRWIVHRGSVTENVETKIARNAAADLPITIGINGADGEEPWVLLTNDPAFEGAAS